MSSYKQIETFRCTMAEELKIKVNDFCKHNNVIDINFLDKNGNYVAFITYEVIV